jgi:hypothetical protein
VIVKSLRRRSKWDTNYYTIVGWDRETLSLILGYARDQLECMDQPSSPVMEDSKKNLLRIINEIDGYINHADAGSGMLAPMEIRT